jgi:hypothetical protein
MTQFAWKRIEKQSQLPGKARGRSETKSNGQVCDGGRSGSLLDNMTSHQDQRQFALGYDAGYSDGYRCGVEDGWARGYDEGLEEAQRLR